MTLLKHKQLIFLRNKIADIQKYIDIENLRLLAMFLWDKKSGANLWRNIAKLANWQLNVWVFRLKFQDL